MKTKDVVIEGWANVYENDKYYGSKFCAHIYESEEKAALNSNQFTKYKCQQVKCKLILEAPEKTVTISESDFAEVWDECQDKWALTNSKDSSTFKIIKSQLFGEDE